MTKHGLYTSTREKTPRPKSSKRSATTEHGDTSTPSETRPIKMAKGLGEVLS